MPEIKGVRPYRTQRAHNFFDVIRAIVGREVQQGNTFTFASEVDLTQIEELRSHWKNGKKPTYTAFIAVAAVLALKKFPYANRRIYQWPFIPFSGTRMQTFNTYDIAVACEKDEPGVEVATFMDVLRNVDQLSLSEVTQWLQILAKSDDTNNEQWRGYSTLVRRVPSWLSSWIIGLPVVFPALWRKWRGGALQISSPAKYGIDLLVGAWPVPLGVSFGFAKDRPIVIDGKIEIRKTFFLVLNWDRRVMAGAQAARFFKQIVNGLENAKSEMSAYLQ